TISVRIEGGATYERLARLGAGGADRPRGRSGGAAGGDGFADLLREHETDVLADHVELRDVPHPAPAEELDKVLHEVLRRAGAGGDTHHAHALQPLLAHLAGVVDQMCIGAA